METLAEWSPLFTAGIFFVGVLWILMTIFGLMLKPLKKQLENHVTDTDKKIDRIESDIKEIKADIKKLLENQK